MGGASIWLAAWLTLLEPGAARESVAIVDFAPHSNPDVVARELCLRTGCEVRHIYRYLPGAAVVGTPLGVLERQPGVLGVVADLPVKLTPGYRLIGAPSHAPLAVVGGGLDPAGVSLDRQRRYGVRAPSSALRAATTALVASLAERMPDRLFWSFEVLGDDGGRLSDVLAAFDDLVSLRFAVAAIYAPLGLDGTPPPRLCRTIDEVLRRGLLVVTDLDAGCPANPYPERP